MPFGQKPQLTLEEMERLDFHVNFTREFDAIPHPKGSPERLQAIGELLDCHFPAQETAYAETSRRR